MSRLYLPKTGMTRKITRPVHSALRYSPSFRQPMESFQKCLDLTNPPVFDCGQNLAPTTNPNQLGPELLISVINKRLARLGDKYKSLFNPDALELICEKSGGVMRDLVRLARTACEVALRRKLIYVDLDAAQEAVQEVRLGRDSLFKRELVLIFWLNKVEFLDEFRNRAPDFWDWRGKVVQFEARPVFNPLFYPYLEWLIAENSYLKISGVMQVQRQVDIFLDQIYVSLQAVRRQQVTETSERGYREWEVMTSRHVGKGRRGGSALDEFELLDEFEPLVPDFVPDAVSTKTVTQKVDLSQAVRENQYCVILGAPGAGKTTLLQYLALHFGMAKRDGMEFVAGGEGQEELGKSLLPIFFRIADYAERLAQEPDLSLLDYLRQFYRQWEAYFKTGAEAITSPPDLDPPLPSSLKLRLKRGEPERNAHPDLAPSLHSEGISPQPPLLRGELELEEGMPFNSQGGEEADIHQLLCEQMRQGQCLMLLDGLDEVFDQESRRLMQLGQEQDVAKLWSLLAACYGDWGKYEQAIEYCQQSLTLCQKLGLEQGSAWNFRAIANSQRLLAKNTPDTAEASNLLTQAEQNIRPAIQLNTAGDYKENLAYDYTALGLLYSERLRLLAPDDSSLPEQIAQFEAYYNTGLTYLTELGETVDRADETLDMARAYLEVSALENLNQAEALAQESLQIFQDYNRRKLEAAARKLLGEIYLKRAQRNQANAEAIAHQFLSESLQLYRELDLTEKAAEVEQLMLFSGE